jgi:hypothetical protein
VDIWDLQWSVRGGELKFGHRCGKFLVGSGKALLSGIVFLNGVEKQRAILIKTSRHIRHLESIANKK